MIIGAVIVVVIIIIVILAAVLISTSKDGSDGGGGDTVTMSVAEYEDNINIQHELDYKGYDNYIKVLFNSLEPGDTLLLEDEITFIDYYDNDWDETEIELGNDRWYEFEGDLTDEFEVGDIVIIEFHVIYVSFEQILDGDTYHYEGETFQEQWDSELDEPSSEPLPRTIISKV